jgi:hypothetical protein
MDVWRESRLLTAGLAFARMEGASQFGKIVVTMP